MGLRRRCYCPHFTDEEREPETGDNPRTTNWPEQDGHLESKTWIGCPSRVLSSLSPLPCQDTRGNCVCTQSSASPGCPFSTVRRGKCVTLRRRPSASTTRSLTVPAPRVGPEPAVPASPGNFLKFTFSGPTCQSETHCWGPGTCA